MIEFNCFLQKQYMAYRFQRFHSTRIKPLRFSNHFYTTGYIKPISDVGFRSINFFTGTPVEQQYWSGGPVTTSSLEEYEKGQRHRREAEQENAGIAVGKEGWRKMILKQQKRKQQLQEKHAMIKYLAEQGEADGIAIERLPKEIQAGVKAYAKQHEAEVKKIHAEQAAEAQALKEEMDKLQDIMDTRYVYGGQFIPSRSRFITRDMLNPAMEYGHRFLDPDQDVSAHEDLLEHRKHLYEDYQKQLRGRKPPKNMVDRAMPKLAEPFSKIAFMKTPHGIVI